VKKFVLRKSADDRELPSIISPELAGMNIRIFGEGYPENGSLYFEGTVRTFIVERLPQPALIEMLPRLADESRLGYCLSKENIIIERVICPIA
jgi:hypothetical protein